MELPDALPPDVAEVQRGPQDVDREIPPELGPIGDGLLPQVIVLGLAVRCHVVAATEPVHHARMDILRDSHCHEEEEEEEEDVDGDGASGQWPPRHDRMGCGGDLWGSRSLLCSLRFSFVGVS